MSVQKHKRSNSKAILKDKPQDNNMIYENVRRIDGQEIVRKYLKCGLLGKGGFANCYITQNVESKRRLATKVVIKEELKSHRTRLRLANQIKLHKTLHHPNVVNFQHCFQDKQNVYIFLELCQNQSLNELIRVRNNFITPQIQSFMLGIVNGVKYIHSQKIIHRDLKLGNIFIDGKFTVKIGDFGLATRLQFKKQCKRTVCGTPNYIAPEVLQGKGYHFEVDIWSIGVILYTFYYGVPPFQTEDANATYQKIKECNYIIPKTMNVPHQAVTLIQKLLVRNPADRPTLDQILMSQFMQLGQGILRELPAVCSRKAPTKKELTLTISLQLNQEMLSKKEILSPKKTEQSSKDFVVEFEQMLEDTFFYRLANDTCGILQKDVRVLYKNQQGKYILKSLTANYQEEAGQCDLKYLLMAKERRFNILDETVVKIDNSKMVFVRKVQRIGEATLLRLSDKTIQFLIDDNIYILSGNSKRLIEMQNSKQMQISISKLISNLSNVKGNKQHLKLIRKIVMQIQAKKQQHSKENRT